MMKSPHCPEHGRAVLDLARGRLDDDAAALAEEILRSCDHCSGWWQAHFEGDSATVVDEAVSEAWAAFSAPRRRRLRPWLAAAAAAVVALAVYWVHDPGRSAHQPAPEIAGAASGGESLVAADRDPARRPALRRTAAPGDLPASVELASGEPRSEAVETDHVLGAVFGGGGSAADAGSLARILGAPGSANG